MAIRRAVPTALPGSEAWSDDRDQNDVAVFHLRTFGLNADLAGCLPAVFGGVLKKVVDLDLQVATVQSDFTLVPLAEGLLVGWVHFGFVSRDRTTVSILHRETVDGQDVAHGTMEALYLDALRPHFILADHAKQHSAITLGNVAELET